MIAFKRRKSVYWQVAMLALVVYASASLAACGAVMMMTGHGAKRPAASEFGFGPRTSAQGGFVGTLEIDSPLKPRRMQTVRVVLRDGNGRTVEGASLRIDGGMPQHGHGLPTRPRVTRNLGNGAYEIEGVRFNMGGWWEFKVLIETAAGADTITFNLEL
jgi:hypothetical protein